MNRLLYFSPSWSGGLADYAHEQAQALGRRGVQVTLLTSPAYKKDKTSLYTIKQTLVSIGKFDFPLALVRKTVLAANILQNYAILAKTIENEGFQYVLFGSYAEYLAPLWVSPLCKLAKQGVTFASVIHDPVRGYVVGPLWWHRWSIACGYSFIKEAFVHEAINLDTEKPMPQLQTTVIPIGIYHFPKHQNSIEEVRTKLKIPQQVKVLLSFGHIRDGKNLDLALKAITHFPNVYLVIAGKVSASTQKPVTYYQDLAQSLGISERCRWLIDFLPEAQVGDLFNACDAVLLTYSASFHSASSVLNLAVNYQRPCITSAGDGNLRTVVQKYQLGVFVKPDDWQAIRDGIQQWLNGIAPPLWEQYEQDNSWDKNAEIICQRFWEK
ncbi:glycosyltransferase family 4 protein [Calothrix sp. FACHB-1219]|uniref:glycosyltransferase family 4 protein n=1 Tax=unclassified Calothrix TaxID=2619626 RepID=UPI0016869CF7|nr:MULTISPECIES: glycosyltransferase family 4 protein [unclassified Calothrix]MBD2201177.1 glycosyltransferase family 4 protein [Calothrix sp. FACHB-168]MBD2215611.1 glycosyltransferase family 4 protein [Calothrix sp. FACHB-1219]